MNLARTTSTSRRKASEEHLSSRAKTLQPSSMDRRHETGSRVGAVARAGSPPTNVARVRFPDSASYVG